MTPVCEARIRPILWNSVPPKRPTPPTGRTTRAAVRGPSFVHAITRPPGRFSMSAIQVPGRSGREVSITRVSPSRGAPSRGRRVPSGASIRTGDPVTGAKPPKNPVPAGRSSAKNAPSAAAGATVTAGTTLTMRPRPFSTSTSMCTALTAEAQTVLGVPHLLAV
ncbi:hypothetical protein [uncultured Fretibacterium sp.]|uniref:hypothetical protein n=1 Tax=uncultured Fretibacterium sp. TaxID=1678694 RepID=UPI00263263F2|nr:hypothetical protein [uncultured Fretibacterium sp.]